MLILRYPIYFKSSQAKPSHHLLICLVSIAKYPICSHKCFFLCASHPNYAEQAMFSSMAAKKTVFFLQLCHLVSSLCCFLFFDILPNFTCSKHSYCCSTYSPVSGIGDSLVFTMLLKLILFLCHLWFIHRKR
jgi:hypothetical protein